MSRFAGKTVFTVIGAIIVALICPFNIFSASPVKPSRPERRTTSPVHVIPDTIPLDAPVADGSFVVLDSLAVTADSVTLTPVDSLAILPGTLTPPPEGNLPDEPKRYVFNPDPTRAVWLSALCPGLGQLYNRRYWKLPIVVGGFMGLGYATTWNNGMLRDYTRAYSDIMDNDPSTKSYMDFFPPTVSESDLDQTWLKNILKSRKDFYRRNRDLCIICMVGVYLIAMVDAYVDAQLAHFDISPNLSVDIAPALIPESRDRFPGIGMQWAFNF